VSGHTAIVLAMLHGVVRADFHRDGTPVNVISPTTVAKHSGITTTMVREAKKAAMIASANERWGMTLGPKDDDIADAIWLADLAQVEWRDGAVS
jgi:Holliday junction resolvasome RuvABC endonuclease subunit